jgi:hypothetical protein
LGLGDGQELGLVDAPVAEIAFETFDIGVLGRPSRGDEAMVDLVFMC